MGGFEKELEQIKIILAAVQELDAALNARLEALPEPERTEHGLNDTSVALGIAEINLSDVQLLLRKLNNGWTGFSDEERRGEEIGMHQIGMMTCPGCGIDQQVWDGEHGTGELAPDSIAVCPNCESTVEFDGEKWFVKFPGR